MRIIYGLFFLVIISACATSKQATDDRLDGTWNLIMFPSSDKTFNEMFTEHKPQLQFEGKNKVYGNTGCNKLSTTFAVKGDQFSFGKNITTTKMACSGYEESHFLNALTKVDHYKINGTQLQLLQDSSLVMVFTKE